MLELSLYSLSHTFLDRVFLEHLNIGSGKAKKAKRKQRLGKEEQDQVATTRLLAGIELHV